MEISKIKTIKSILLLLLLLAVCCSCEDKELAIESIGENSYPYGGYYFREDIEEPPCIDSLQYYAIENYEQISSDSLSAVLNRHIYSRYPYEKYIENSMREPPCNFHAFFYKKSLFVDYRKYLSDAMRSEMGGIDEYRYKLVAVIHSYSHKEEYGSNRHKYIIFTTVLYNKLYNDIYPSNMIKWLKKDTVRVQLD